MARRRYAGVDVGGRRKGFHAAVLDGHRVELFASPEPGEVVAWLAERRPRVVAVDSPCDAAPDGLVCRAGEREVIAARDLPNVRSTPDMRTMLAREDGYYEWVLNGLRLWEDLDRAAEWEVVECFPTASWTRWAGPRGGRSRSEWSREALGELRLDGVPARASQDQRDAIAAAMTAFLHAEGETERFGPIVVPLGAPGRAAVPVS